MVYEIRIKVYLLKSISFSESISQIGELIDTTFGKDEKYKMFHQKNAFKYYTFASFFPLEKDKIYKEGNIYSLQIRTVDENLKNFFMDNLKNAYTDNMKSLTISCNTVKQKLIEQIYSITPFVMKFDKGYWKGHENIDTVFNRIKVNLIKKYNAFYNLKIDEDFDFFNHFNLNNKLPISIEYKNIKMLGDKGSFIIDSNPMAQKLAYFALGTGIGEMSSRGFGFVNYKEC